MENPEFKGVLQELLARKVGAGEQNRKLIASKLRDHVETFTVDRLHQLLAGIQPSQAERIAVSLVLEPEGDQWLSENWPLEDLKSRRLAKFAFARLRSHALAIEFVGYVLVDAYFRNEDRSESVLKELLAQFRQKGELEVEIDVFDLRF